MAKISATTFVVGYSILLLILFVTFSVLMSNVNPDRMFFEDEVGPDPKIPPDEDTTGKGDEVPVTLKAADRLIHSHRLSDANDTFTEQVKDKNTDKVPQKENLAKERRSLKDPTSVLDQLGIVILEVVDEEGLPRIEFIFHPKHSLIETINKKRGDFNIKKSFRAYDKAKTRKGLVTDLADNSVIKIMPDNTIVLENSNILVSEENVAPNSSAEVPSTNVEIGSFLSITLDSINTTTDSAIVAVNDKSQSETTTFQSNITLQTVDEKQFDDIETIETTTDDTFERTTYIDNVFKSVDIIYSKTSYFPETINFEAFVSNDSIITTYSYTSETTNLSEKYNDTETTDADYFDDNDTISTELTTELDITSITQITNKPTPEGNYATETKNDMQFEVLYSKNTAAEVMNYKDSDTTVLARVKSVDASGIIDRNETTDGIIYKDSDIFENTKESLELETKNIPGGKTFDVNDRINEVYATDKVRNIIKTATDANIFQAVVERVETLLNAETSDDLLLQNTETSINTSPPESTIEMKNLLKVVPVINTRNATNAVGNTIDNTTDRHVAAKSVPNSSEGYLAATETIFNDE